MGFFIFFSSHNISYDTTDLIYAVIKLFIIDNDYPLTHVNIYLNIARFLAPLSLATAITQGMLKLYSIKTNFEKVKRFNNHIIICGNAESNKMFQDIIDNKNEDFIFIMKKKHEDMNHVQNTFYFQNINTVLLTNIAFYKSRYLIVSFQNDAESLNFTNALLNSINFNQIQKEIDIIILFKDPCWAELSSDMGILGSINSKVSNNKYLNVRYMNFIDKTIRKHMLDYTPDIIKPITNISDPALAVGVIGSNTIMQRLVINLALNSHYINHKKLKVYIAHNSSAEFSSFSKKYQLNETLEILETDIEDLYKKEDLSGIYICEDNELKLMQHIISLQESEHLSSIKRIIFIEQSNNISSLLPMDQNKIIDISKEIGTFSHIIDESLDNLAKTIHNDYLTKWDLLPDERKDQHRMQADHMGIKIRSLGCKTVPISSHEEAFDWRISYSRLEDLSKAEHNRWKAYKYYKGWKQGERDDRKKTHPDIIPYEKLEYDIQQYDRNAILNIPKLLNQIGQKAVKVEKKL